MTQMIQLNEVLGNKAAVALLQYFALHPTIEVTFTQLRKETGLATATLAKWLECLTKNGLITSRELGNMRPYLLKADHPFVLRFKILLTVMRLLPLTDISKKFGCSIFLFGSSARGEDIEQSDIDLLIIGEEHEAEIKSAIGRQKHDRHLSAHLFSAIEWAGMAQKDPAFYERVEKDKIRLA